MSDVDVAKQETDIYRLIDLSLRFCAEHKTDRPAIWACQRLVRLKTIEQNFPVILDALFRLALEFPRCTSHVTQFLINNQRLCTGESKVRTLRWIKSTLKLHLPHGNDFELSWCFLACGALKIVLNKDDLPATNVVPNAIVLVMLGLLHEKGLLGVPFSAWRWRAHLKKQGLYSEYWLPFFEAVRRNWTKDKRLIAAVKSDSVMAKMLAAKVSFLEDQVFEAKNLDVARRVFSKVATPAVSKPRQRTRRLDQTGIAISDFDY